MFRERPTLPTAGAWPAAPARSVGTSGERVPGLRLPLMPRVRRPTAPLQAARALPLFCSHSECFPVNTLFRMKNKKISSVKSSCQALCSRKTCTVPVFFLQQNSLWTLLIFVSLNVFLTLETNQYSTKTDLRSPIPGTPVKNYSSNLLKSIYLFIPY